MFEKSLTDVVRGIRKTKRDKPKFIQQCIDEIKAEIASSDMFVKANALQKLTFFQMMGYSMNWASFATIEVMSSTKFSQKRIGYLAASQGFRQDTEVILLTTNLLKKELQNASVGGLQGVYNAGLALNCLSNIVTEDLARDLLPEVTNLTTHHQPYLRKKSVLVLFKMFVRYPEGLRLTFSKLQKCMEDPNSAVVSCAVNVITELSDKNPKNYLSLAPAFFQLLSKSSNNWMLIKVVKLLGSLVPEEPRLARKLLEPLAEIVRSTQAKSLLYESVYTITLCLPYTRKSDGSMPSNVPAIVDLCATTLHDFVQQTDQNLKYLGLVGFGSLMQSHSSVLSDPKYRPLVLSCLSDDDVTIRTRALELCPGISSRKNLRELVEQLLNHVEAATGEYKLDLVAKVIEMCSGDKYAMLQDFGWYVGVLFRLGHVRGIERHGELLRSQIIDVALRVLPVRPFVVRRSIGYLMEVSMDNSRESHEVHQILPAAAWVIGEYSDCIVQAIALDDPEAELDLTGSDGIYDCLVQRFMALDERPAATEKIFVQAAMKVTAAASSNKTTTENELQSCLMTLEKFLPVYARHLSSEVAEQAVIALSVLRSLGLTSDTTAIGSIQSSLPTEDLIGIEGFGEGKLLTSPNVEKSVGSRMKEQSPTLVYLFKPSPMKPCGAKAQRKKHQAIMQSMPSFDVQNVLRDLFAEEDVDSRRTTESVSFTQQTPFTTVENTVDVPTKRISAGKSAPSPWSSNATTTRPRHDDPFYLEQDSMEPEATKEGPNRFGAIQLLDSEDEADEADHQEVKRKKKKKSKKRGKTSTPVVSVDPGLLPLDDDESENGNSGGGRESRPKRRPGREFAGLARVDLTKPPTPDSHQASNEFVPPNRPHTSKKPKKNKKHKSTAKVASKQATVDLLDLGGDISAGLEPTKSPFADTQPMIHTSADSNPISSAFDIFAPVTSSQLQVSSTTPNFSSPQFWLKASLKSSPSSIFNSDAMNILYKVGRDTFGSPTSYMLQLQCRSTTQESFPELSIVIGEEVVRLGSLSPMGVCTAQHTFQMPKGPKDLKGELRGADGDLLSVKMRMPCVLQPEPGLSLDQLAAEMSSNSAGWTSASGSVETNGHNATSSMEALRLFFNAATVGPPSPASVSWAALCSGSHVRFLVKAVADNSIKVDIKATNPDVCKALISDMKRLRLM